jgi:gamma-glutamyltranspeptidase/glutathione hydrolase
MPFGVMGGHYQPVGHVHLLTNVLDHGMDLQEALDSPRVFHNGNMLEVEAGVPRETVAGLRERGHEIVVASNGGGQAIRIDWDRGTLEGGSDPRKDGCALGY